MINSVFRTGKNCYPHMLLEACKYVAEEKYMPGYITDNVEFSSGDSDREDSNKEKNKKRVILKTFLLYIYSKIEFCFLVGLEESIFHY